ncbi:hypothetical protein, partial [Anaerococcus tetradius]|uniref:hypothetical protein n=1 Tax=Anaerococcus tetradius TaxID=33036 RepID=UPI0023F15BA8
QGTENPRVGGSIPPLGTKKQACPAQRGPSTEWSQGRRSEKASMWWEQLKIFIKNFTNHEKVI